ncbi:MAG TPA: AAA family ATPase [Haliangium sp.]|nr:AAA family ATPase [Haliangium sp.]
MYLRKVEIRNVRSIARFVWEAPPDPAGWHVLIGDNGSGKTTILRSIALALLGTNEEAYALREDWRRWIRHQQDTATIRLEFRGDPDCDPAARAPSDDNDFIAVTFDKKLDFDGVGESVDAAYHTGRGWFSASYGPFRRFAGDDEEDRKLYGTHPRLARHITLFGDRYALSGCIPWLISLKHRELAAQQQGAGDDHPDVRALNAVVAFVNQPGFLPHGTQLSEITADHVRFRDGNGAPVTLQELSDGYRSVLGMTLELLRQLLGAYDLDRVFDPAHPAHVSAPGVVLIDEVDAHLHPTWQRDVGYWLRKHFPRIQFLVTTHSPIVCRAATRGSVYRLPVPGTDETATRIEGPELDRLLYGNVLEAYGTGVFGADVTRSQEGTQRLHRLAELNVKELDEGLTPEEEDEQEGLRAALPTAAHTQDPAQP